jgi:hypothetical protein
MSFAVARSNIAVTKPDGKMFKKEVILYWDGQTQSVGVKFVGESPLKGYTIDVLLTEINRVMTQGVPMERLPDRI